MTHIAISGVETKMWSYFSSPCVGLSNPIRIKIQLWRTAGYEQTFLLLFLSETFKNGRFKRNFDGTFSSKSLMYYNFNRLIFSTLNFIFGNYVYYLKFSITKFLKLVCRFLYKYPTIYPLKLNCFN